MKHGLGVFLIGLAQIAFALSASAPWSFLLVWSGLSWMAAGASYTALGPRVFGKRVDGRLGPINTIILLPYLLPTWGTWHLQRLTSKDDVCNEIVDGVWLGRRCSGRRLPVGITSIVDMTCEFVELREVVDGRTYVCVPTPDGHVPTVDALSRAVDEAASSTMPVYVHCAVGRGRSAMFVAALLLRLGRASTVDEAEAIVKAKRPCVHINRTQRRLLETYATKLAASSPG